MAKGTKKGWVNGLASMSDAAKDALKRPLIVGSIKRGFESAIDSKTEIIIDKQFQLQQVKEEIAGGKVSKIKELVDLTIQIEAEQKVIDTLEGLRTEAFVTPFDIEETEG